MKLKLPNRNSAFTLIELISAMAILGILVIILAMAFTQVSKSWQQADSRIESFQAARLALEMIARELEGASVRTNSLPSPKGHHLPFLAVESITDLQIRNPPDDLGGTVPSKALNTSGDASPNDQLFFVAPAPTSNGDLNIDLHEYGYCTVYASSDTGALRGKRYYLLKADSDSANAGFDCIYPSAPLWYQTPNTGGFADTSRIPIVDNAIRFELDYIDSSGGWSDVWTSDSSLPRSVIITLTVLDRRGSERLAVLRPSGLSATEIGYVPGNIQALASTPLFSLFSEYSRTFTRQVNLMNTRGQ